MLPAAIFSALAVPILNASNSTEGAADIESNIDIGDVVSEENLWRTQSAFSSGLVCVGISILCLYVVYISGNLIQLDESERGVPQLSVKPGCAINVLSQVAFMLRRALAARRAHAHHGLLHRGSGLFLCVEARCLRPLHRDAARITAELYDMQLHKRWSGLTVVQRRIAVAVRPAVLRVVEQHVGARRKINVPRLAAELMQAVLMVPALEEELLVRAESAMHRLPGAVRPHVQPKLREIVGAVWARLKLQYFDLDAGDAPAAASVALPPADRTVLARARRRVLGPSAPSPQKATSTKRPSASAAPAPATVEPVAVAPAELAPPASGAPLPPVPPVPRRRSSLGSAARLRGKHSIAVAARVLQRLPLAAHRRRSSAPRYVESRSNQLIEVVTAVVNDLVDFDALRPMHTWWARLMGVWLVAFCTMVIFSCVVVAVGNRSQTSRQIWYVCGALLFLVVNGLQVAYTRFWLRRQAKTLTLQLAESAEATLLGLCERDDAMALVGALVDSAVDETLHHLRPFDAPARLVFDLQGGRDALIEKVKARFDKRTAPRIRLLFQRLRSGGDGDDDGDEQLKRLELRAQSSSVATLVGPPPDDAPAKAEAVTIEESGGGDGCAGCGGGKAAGQSAGSSSPEATSSPTTLLDSLGLGCCFFGGPSAGAEDHLEGFLDLESPSGDGTHDAASRPPASVASSAAVKGGIPGQGGGDDGERDELDDFSERVAAAVAESAEQGVTAQLQAKVRGVMTRRSLTRQHSSATRLQAAARGRAARNKQTPDVPVLETM